MKITDSSAPASSTPARKKREDEVSGEKKISRERGEVKVLVHTQSFPTHTSSEGEKKGHSLRSHLTFLKESSFDGKEASVLIAFERGQHHNSQPVSTEKEVR